MHEPLPSFKEQLAVVANDYLSTMGGGERSTLAYAKALADLDFEVEILCRNDIPAKERIRDIFGDEYTNVRMRRVSAANLHSYLKPAGLAVFVNHTFMSFERNPARVGLYSQMFPERAIARTTHPTEVAALSSYQHLLCNSSFTKLYTDATWHYPSARSLVLHPPIGTAQVRKAQELLSKQQPKRKQFVNLGRFNPGTHNKNQKIVIEAFLDAQARYPELSAWRLVLVGNRNDDDASRAYYDDCARLAASSGQRVEIRQGLSADDLTLLLEESFGYVHATGAFHLPGHDPHKCEHFGLAIVEAMAHGCIPLVYARGGIFDILAPGAGGIPYISREGLIDGYREVAADFETERGEARRLVNLRAASGLSQQNFTRALARIIAGAMRA